MNVIIWEIDEKTGRKTGRKSRIMSEGEAKIVIIALETSPDSEGKRFSIEPATTPDEPPQPGVYPLVFITFATRTIPLKENSIRYMYGTILV